MGCGHKPLTLLAATLFLFSQAASAATYWVATTGNDANSGTQTAPFRHLTKAAAVAQQPGDTVIVRDGTYDNEGKVGPSFVMTLYYSGTAASPITFKAENRGKAILDSMNTTTDSSCNGAASYINLYNAHHIVIEGFVIQRGCDSGIQSNDSAHDITIRWNEVRNIANRYITDQIGRDGIYLNPSEYNFTFDGNIFHDIGRTGGTSLLHFDHGIYAHSANTVIINNIFYNMNRGWPIQLADGASNWLVSNNTFAFPSANGEEGQIMFWGSNTNITVRNNIFYNPTGNAMTRYAATINGCLFDHNLIYGVSGVIGDTSGFSISANQTGANPNFVNAGAYNFHVNSGSPAIDSGVNSTSVPNDLENNNRPQGSSTDLGAYEYGSASTPPVISGVFSSGVTTNSAYINWSTDKPATSYVDYGPGSYSNSTTPDTTLLTMHSVALSGLTASTLYHYRVGSKDSSGALTLSSDYTFTTAALPPPPPPPPTTFSLSSTQAALSVTQGGSAGSGITATLLTGSAAAVTFTTSPLPAGATANFAPGSCTATCSTSLTLSTASSTPAGVYSVVVTGTGGGTSATTAISLTVTSSGGSGTPDFTTGLASNWKFNEGSGSYASDSSGNGNTGTLNSVTWGTSSTGPFVSMSGNGGYVSVNESPSLALSNQMSVSFWAYAKSTSNIDPRVVSKLYSWDVKLNTANRYPQLSAGGKYAMLNYSLPLNAWHHIVFTFSNGVVSGYVDGVPATFQANTFTGTETLPLQALGMNIGADANGANSYAGNLEDLRIYNRALSGADAAALYSSFRPAAPATPTAPRGNKKHY